MEHPRKALQGLNDNFIHGHVLGLVGLAFSNREPLLFGHTALHCLKCVRSSSLMEGTVSQYGIGNSVSDSQ